MAVSSCVVRRRNAAARSLACSTARKLWRSVRKGKRTCGRARGTSTQTMAARSPNPSGPNAAKRKKRQTEPVFITGVTPNIFIRCIRNFVECAYRELFGASSADRMGRRWPSPLYFATKWLKQRLRVIGTRRPRRASAARSCSSISRSRGASRSIRAMSRPRPSSTSRSNSTRHPSSTRSTSGPGGPSSSIVPRSGRRWGSARRPCRTPTTWSPGSARTSCPTSTGPSRCRPPSTRAAGPGTSSRRRPAASTA
jgi:hypothetical protein